MAPSPNNLGEICHPTGSSSDILWSCVDFEAWTTDDPQLSTAAPGHERDGPEQEQDVPVAEPAASAPKKTKKRIFSETDTQTERRNEPKKNKSNIVKVVNVPNVRVKADTTRKVEGIRAGKKQKQYQKTSKNVNVRTEGNDTEAEDTEADDTEADDTEADDTEAEDTETEDTETEDTEAEDTETEATEEELDSDEKYTEKQPQKGLPQEELPDSEMFVWTQELKALQNE
ncbi:hypothetical protein GX51_08186, partial [Blastomyces parvus]